MRGSRCWDRGTWLRSAVLDAPCSQVTPESKCCQAATWARAATYGDELDPSVEGADAVRRILLNYEFQENLGNPKGIGEEFELNANGCNENGHSPINHEF